MDLNMMMREQARNGLQAALDTAVTNGDAEAARKIAKDLETLAVSTAPKAPPYGDGEIKAELGKLDWFGVDPKKSARVIELGKHMDPKKFGTAADFAAALVKAVDAEFPPPAAAGAADDDEDDEEPEDGEKPGGKEKPAARRTDGPGEGDANNRTIRRASSGPWTKLADAPADVQKEIKRAADKFVSSNAAKGQRDAYIAKALESHYGIHQRKAGKK
jgi:hypothetical protein